MPIDITKPTVGGDIGSWGDKLNNALDALKNGINSEEAARLGAATGSLYFNQDTGQLLLATVAGSDNHWVMTPVTSVPTAPALTVQSGDTTALASWTSAANAATYQLWSGPNADGSNAVVVGATQSATIQTVSPLTNGVRYYMFVTAFNAGGVTGPRSNIVLVTPNSGSTTTVTVPSAPTLTATAGAQSAIVSLAFGSQGVTSARITRQLVGGGGTSGITFIAAGTPSINGFGTTNTWTIPILAQTNDLMVIGVSTYNGTTINTPSGFTKITQLSNDNGSTNNIGTFYRFITSSDTPGTTTVTANTSGSGQQLAMNLVVLRGVSLSTPIDFTSPALVSGASTSYTLGSGGTGTSSAADAVLAVYSGTRGGGPHALSSAPTGFTEIANASQSSVFASQSMVFGAAGNAAGAAVGGYAIAYTGGSEQTQAGFIPLRAAAAAPTGPVDVFTGVIGLLPFIDNNLTAGQQYQYIGYGSNAAGESVASASQTVTPTTPTPTLTVPGAPTSLSLTAGNGQVSATWLAPADTGGSVLLSYIVTLSTTGTVTVTGTGGGLPPTFTPVTAANGTAVTATVVAVNAQGSSTASATSNSVTPSSTIPNQRLYQMVFRNSGSSVSGYEAWQGAAVDFQEDYVDHFTWSDYEFPDWQKNGDVATGRPICIGAPSFVCDNTPAAKQQQTLGGVQMGHNLCASGSYDTHHTNLANRLLSSYPSAPIIVVRANHEFNGSWFAHRCLPGDEANFRASTQRLITNFRAAATAASRAGVFLFDWNIAGGNQSSLSRAGVYSAVNVDACYPGDSYIDIFGYDWYDRMYDGTYSSRPPNAAAQQRGVNYWMTGNTNTADIVNEAKAGVYSVNWLRNYAKAGAVRNGVTGTAKYTSLPEVETAFWDSANGGGDNAIMVQQVYNILHDRVNYNFLYFGWWEDPANGDNNLYPQNGTNTGPVNARAKYLALRPWKI